MSGFGIRQQWQASRKLADPDSTLWRPASFLQQLSLNGSMLLVKNHDRLWLELLAEELNERGRGWQSLSARLRTMPAGQSRRILWQASYKWWQSNMQAYADIHGIAWHYNLLENKNLANYHLKLRRTAAQLENLAWCAYDSQREPISVIDLENKAQLQDTPQ